ncbi:abscisate beta-glucosyltransferase-like [Actinidia eriantha]|uniref:abscisate beta-glucosyltransferase-like n=1 Tax=Actinidia eriantha TaxID=165200 RepID=UPI002585A21A|nr:abscisate beta-glucosyltransferase-like [Actinidia eriantha]
MVRIPDAQFIEIALALQASGHPFVWVVRKEGKAEENGAENWLPQGLQERVEENNKGIVTRGWAPQVRMGGFMTHCGWNSVVSGRVCENPGFEMKSPVVGSDKILKAVNRLMGGYGEAEEIVRRAKELAEMADRSVEEGGSTYTDLKALIEEIKEVVFQKN